jgi:hypothetical protein
MTMGLVAIAAARGSCSYDTDLEYISIGLRLVSHGGEACGGRARSFTSPCIYFRGTCSETFLAAWADTFILQSSL